MQQWSSIQYIAGHKNKLLTIFDEFLLGVHSSKVAHQILTPRTMHLPINEPSIFQKLWLFSLSLTLYIHSTTVSILVGSLSGYRIGQELVEYLHGLRSIPRFAFDFCYKKKKYNFRKYAESCNYFYLYTRCYYIIIFKTCSCDCCSDCPATYAQYHY